MVIRGNMEDVWFAGGMNCQVLGRLSLDIIFHHCKQNNNSFPVVSRRTKGSARSDGKEENSSFLLSLALPLTLLILVGTLRSNDATATRTSKKKIDFKSKTTTLQEHYTFFSTFFPRFSTTTTWKCLISRFMENVNKQRRNLISLSELGYGP